MLIKCSYKILMINKIPELGIIEKKQILLSI